MIVTKDGLKYDGDSNPIKLSISDTYSASKNTLAYAENTICNEIQSVTIKSFRVIYTDSNKESHDDYHPNVHINGTISEDNPMKAVIVLITNFLTITITASQENCFKIAATFNGQGYSLTSLSLGGTITYLFDNFLKIEGELTSIGKGLSVGLNASIGGDVSIGGSLTVPSDKGIEVGELTGGSINISSMSGGSITINSASAGNIYIGKDSGANQTPVEFQNPRHGTLIRAGGTSDDAFYVEAEKLSHGHLYWVRTFSDGDTNHKVEGIFWYAEQMESGPKTLNMITSQYTDGNKKSSWLVAYPDDDLSGKISASTVDASWGSEKYVRFFRIETGGHALSSVGQNLGEIYDLGIIFPSVDATKE